MLTAGARVAIPIVARAIVAGRASIALERITFVTELVRTAA
jgi:hypothetical protein